MIDTTRNKTRRGDVFTSYSFLLFDGGKHYYTAVVYSIIPMVLLRTRNSPQLDIFISQQTIERLPCTVHRILLNNLS